jgi:hypothetical protein
MLKMSGYLALFLLCSLKIRYEKLCLVLEQDPNRNSEIRIGYKIESRI